MCVAKGLIVFSLRTFFVLFFDFFDLLWYKKDIKAIDREMELTFLPIFVEFTMTQFFLQVILPSITYYLDYLESKWGKKFKKEHLSYLPKTQIDFKNEYIEELKINFQECIEYYYYSFYNYYFKRNSINRHMNFLLNNPRNLYWYIVYEEFVSVLLQHHQSFNWKERMQFCKSINGKSMYIGELKMKFK